MGGQLSVIFSDKFMVKIENDIVVPLKLKFYWRYVDNMFNRRKVKTNGILFETLNNYHPKLNSSLN